MSQPVSPTRRRSTATWTRSSPSIAPAGARRGSDFHDTAFHRELAREALARGWLRLWLLELDGRPIAAWHGFRVGPVASYYQAGRDPSYERFSVGFVLLAHSIRSAIAEGATEYRFGRGDEPLQGQVHEHGPRARDRCAEPWRRRRGGLRGRACRSLRARAQALIERPGPPGTLDSLNQGTGTLVFRPASTQSGD